MYLFSIRKQQILSYLSLPEILIFSLATIFYQLKGLSIFADGDIAWHISSGHLIRELKNIPIYDSWSYAGHIQQWYNLSWLWDIIISYIYDFFGLNGLRTITSLTFGLSISFIHFDLRQRFNIKILPTSKKLEQFRLKKLWNKLIQFIKNDENYSLSNSSNQEVIRVDSIALTTSLISLLLLNVYSARPHLASFFIAFIVYRWIGKYHKDCKNTNYLQNRFVNLVLKCSLITILWANLHGGFIVFYFILLPFIAQAIYKKERIILLQYITLGLSCFLVCFINPIGYKIYIGVLRTFYSALFNNIMEWQPFVFSYSYGSTIFIIIILLSALAYRRHYLQLKIDIYEWLSSIIWLFFSMLSIRNFSMLAVLGSRTIAAVIDSVLPHALYPLRFTSELYKANIISLIILPIVILFAPIHIGLDNAPLAEINFIKNNFSGYKFFNHYNIGGSLIFLGQGKFQHFIDGRAGTVFTEDTIKDYLYYLYDDNEKWNYVLDKYYFDGAIIPKGDLKRTSVSNYFSNWQLVFSGNYGNVYIRKNKIIEIN